MHLDANVLDDSVMPGVDYRMRMGLDLSELNMVFRILLSNQHAVGVYITIFNPKLDIDGSIAKNFGSTFVSGMVSSQDS